MKQYKLIAQHYDMVPGTVVWEVPSFTSGDGLFTVDENNVREPYFRMIPYDKVERVK